MATSTFKALLGGGFAGAILGAIVGGISANAAIRNVDLENQKFHMSLDALRRVYADIDDPEQSKRELDGLQLSLDIGFPAALQRKIASDAEAKGKLIAERAAAKTEDEKKAIIEKQMADAAALKLIQAAEQAAKNAAVERILGRDDGRICRNASCSDWILP
jgi:hypothetical protein